MHHDNDAIYGRLYDILRAIQSSSGDLGTFIPYFMPDSSYDFSSSDWSSYKRMKVDENIAPSVSDVTSSSLGVRFSDFLNDILNNTYYTSRALTSRVLGSGFTGTAYNALVNIRSGSNYGYNAGSLWADMKSGFRQMTIGLNYLVGDDNGSYHLTDYNNSSVSVPNHSLYDYFRLFGMTVSDSLGRLAYVLANDEDIVARDASSSVRAAYTNDFLKPSGSASASVSDFGTLASGSSSLSDSFHSSYGASDALGALSDQGDGRWDWFSQTTMDNLNSSGNRSSSMLKSNRGYTNFYEERYRMINHD